MNITQNIQNLLYRHDCVILPGFGGFVANYKPARVDYDRSIFSPPSKEIGFNSQLQHNDGLLISDVSLSSGLAYLDSKRNVDEYIKEIKSKLEKGKKVVLDDLGAFYLEKDKLLQFEPDRTRNYLVDSFGLSSFEFSELEEYDVRKRIQKKQVTKNNLSTNRRKIIRRALIAVPILVALVIIPLKTNIFGPKKDFLSMDPFNQTELTNPAISTPLTEAPAKNIDSASLMPEINESKTISDKQDSSPVPEPEALIEDSEMESNSSPEIIDPSPIVQYYVIAGSFENESNASRLQNALSKDGYDSKILDAANGFYRVTLSKFPDFWKARKAMNEFQEKHPGESYWILKN